MHLVCEPEVHANIRQHSQLLIDEVTKVIPSCRRWDSYHTDIFRCRHPLSRGLGTKHNTPHFPALCMSRKDRDLPMVYTTLRTVGTLSLLQADSCPAVRMHQHLLRDLDERILWHFNSTSGSSRIASSAYQKWPTKNFHSMSRFN